MKITLLFLIACCFSLLTGCSSKRTDPKPNPSEGVGQNTTASSTYLEFRLFDASEGDQFNAALNARIYYFPLSWSEAQIKAYFGNPDTNPNWNDSPRAADEEYDFDNVVAPGYGWSADPGFIHLDLASQRQIAIVWLFTEADPNCRRSYREQLFIWNGLGENYTLKTDRSRAGL